MYTEIIERLESLEKKVDKLCETLVDEHVEQTTEVGTETSRMLDAVGVPCHLRGYPYLIHAIDMVVEDPQVLNSITKTMYPEVARAFGVTPSQVERCIRHAVGYAYSQGSSGAFSRYFGSVLTECPTNSRFIATLAMRLRRM